MARVIIMSAIILAVPMVAVLPMPQPGIGPMGVGDPGPLGAITVGAGIFAYVVGLAWMIRIYRTDPEAHRSFWRSRRH